MSEYIPKYPSEEGDDSNKTSSELLAETLKPIYVPQELMLAWESHLASYSRDTHVLLDQVKDSEAALNTQYQALLARVQKYEQMLQDITMDSNEFTMDTDIVNFTGWNILAQASYWDYLLRKEITKLRDQIKSVEYRGELVSDVSNSVLESLSKGNEHISNIIGALTDSPLIRDLDAALSGTSTGLSELRIEHERLKAKQYADAIALADQNGETFDQLTLTFNNLISEQIDRIADEAATRTRVIQELEDGITAEAQLRHEGLEAIASQVLAIKSSTETAVAGILQDYSTIAGTNEAITTALNTYSAEVDGTIATILTDYVSYANLDYALTSKSDELLAIVNNNIAKLNITNEITAGLASVKALSTVTVDLNGVVSGYGLISELENGVVQSAFGVNADTFYIGKPTDKVKPFVVTTVPKNIDGVDFPAGTWINSAIIANATIGTAHIKDAAITNAKIKELDASKITTGTLDAKRIRVGDTTQFDSGFAPADVLNNAKTYADTKTKTFTVQPTTPYSVGAIYRNGSSIYVCTTGRASGSYVAGDWTLVGDVTAINTAADTAKVNGVSATTVASNAANGAAVYADVMSDLKITPVEKTAINQEWNRIQKEYASLLAQAQGLGLTTTTYTSAYTGLSTTDPAMSTILSSMSTTTTLTAAQRDAYKTQYTTYYTQAVATIKAINDKIAANAKAQSDAAKAVADSATSQLTLWKYPNTTYIDGGKIYANSITANQINVANLSAISANLGTIQVGTANIADTAITTAKIGDLQVDTLQIKGNAVTVPVSAFAEATIQVGTTYTTVQTLKIPTDLGHTILTFGAVFSFNGFAAKQQLLCQVLKDGKVVFTDLEVFFLDSATVGMTTLTSGSHNHSILLDVSGTVSSGGGHSHSTSGGSTGNSTAGDWNTSHNHSYSSGSTSSVSDHSHGLSLRSSASTVTDAGHTHKIDIQNQSKGAGTLNLSRHDSTGIAGTFQLQLRSASGGNVTVSQRYIHAMTMRK